VNVISKRGLLALGKKHPAATDALMKWFSVAGKSRASSFNEMRRTFPTVDQVGNVLVFNLVGGSYRLIVRVNYAGQTLFVKAVLTHREYDRKEWMKWA
jgi:mRNA interferase HigB